MGRRHSEVAEEEKLVPYDVVGGADEPVKVEADKKTFEIYCSMCHASSRHLGIKKDQAGWESTVSRMSGYHKKFGAVIPEEDRNTIINYLVKVAGK